MRPLMWEQPVVVVPDPVLGWRNRPGVHRLTFGSAPRQRVIPTSIGADGERLAGRRPRDPALPEVAVIGCSFTYGWGVDDDQAYPALAARKRRELRFVNLASPGYGTYQALLALKQRYATRPPPRAVVYGLVDHHADRNVATARWRYLLWLFSRRGTVAVPSVTLDAAGRLVPHPPEQFAFPALLRPSHALSRYWLWAAVRFDPRREQRDRVTRMLLADMQQWAVAHGAALVVATLDGRPSSWRDELRARAIPYVEARPYRMLPYDTHPDWGFHRDVAARLVGALSRVVP
jgi:hypothetical protein